MSDYWLEPHSVELIVVHCSATKEDQNFDVEDIRRWHINRGFNDIGYHFVITRDGTIQKGRPMTNNGAHAIRYNDKSIGICLIGGIDQNSKPEDNFTDEQKMVLGDLIYGLKELFPKAAIAGHRDLDSKHNRLKACPSFDVRTWWLDFTLSIQKAGNHE